jgi:hypothetical protein
MRFAVVNPKKENGLHVVVNRSSYNRINSIDEQFASGRDGLFDITVTCMLVIVQNLRAWFICIKTWMPYLPKNQQTNSFIGDLGNSSRLPRR